MPEHPPRPKAALRDSKKASEAGERQAGEAGDEDRDERGLQGSADH